MSLNTLSFKQKLSEIYQSQHSNHRTLTAHVSSKVMYTEFKVYQLNFKPGCPSSPPPTEWQ